jgi:hypothetical protein
LRIDDTAKAKAFAKEPGLKAAMKKGGVLGVPTMTLRQQKSLCGNSPVRYCQSLCLLQIGCLEKKNAGRRGNRAARQVFLPARKTLLNPGSNKFLQVLFY